MSAGTAARQLLITSESDVALVDHVGTLRVTNWFQDLPLRHVECDAPLPSIRVDDAAALGATAPSAVYSVSQNSKADAVLVSSQHAVALVPLPSRTERARQRPCPDYGPGSLSRAPAAVFTSEFNTTLVGHSVPAAPVSSGIQMGGGFSLAAPIPGSAARSGAGGAAGAGATVSSGARKADLELEQDVAVTVEPPARRHGIARYSLAWGKNAVERVDGATDFNVPAGATTMTLPRGTRVPRDTTHLLAFAHDSAGAESRVPASIRVSAPPIECRAVTITPATSTARVVQAMFHPLSDAHVVVLCSSCVRLYDLRAIGEAVLDVSLDDGPGSTSPAVACAFGALRGCERFALFVAREDGEVAVVCPFVPSGTAVRMAEWQVLVDDALAELDAVGDDDAEGAAHLERHAEWLQGHAWKTLCDSGAAADGVDDAGFGWKVYQVEMDKLSCELPVAAQPMDVQPMVQTASGGGLRSIATVPALVTSVTVIVRLHATGRADVLASVDPVETRWSADEHVAPVQWTQLYTTELGFPVPYRGPAPCLEVDPVAGHLVYAASPTSVVGMDLDWLCGLDGAVEELADDGGGTTVTLEPTTRLRAYPVDTREGYVVGVQVVSDARLGHWLVVLQQSSAGTVFRKHKVHTDNLLQSAADGEAELAKLHDTLSHFEDLIKNVNAGWLLRTAPGGQRALLVGPEAAHAMPTAAAPARDELDPLVPLRAATSHLLTRVINPMRAVHETCARRMDVRNKQVKVQDKWAKQLVAVLDGVRDGMDAHAAEIARMRAKEKELQARAQRVLQALQSGAEKETKAERAFVVEMNSHQRDCAELQGSVETLLRASDRLTMWQESVIDAAAAGDVAAVRRLIKSSARPAPASAASTLNLALRAASRASHSAMVEYLCSLPPQFGVDPRSARADDVARGRFARREVAAVVQELSGQGRDIDMCNGLLAHLHEWLDMIAEQRA